MKLEQREEIKEQQRLKQDARASQVPSDGVQDDEDLFGGVDM